MGSLILFFINIIIKLIENMREKTFRNFSEIKLLYNFNKQMQSQ